MLFSKKDHRKKGGGPATVLRLFLSVLIMAVMIIGLLLAYKSFSGYDPLKVSPKATLKQLLTSQGAYEFLVSLLSFNPKDSVEKAKGAFQNNSNSSVASNATGGSNENKKLPVNFKFAVIADSHKDTASLGKALKQAKEGGAKFIIGMGDFSEVGTIDELRDTKEQFDIVGLPYYVTPGDHDLWDSRDKKNEADKNFKEVFGSTYQSFSYDLARFLIVYNADNYLGVDGVQTSFIDDEVKKFKASQSKLLFVVIDTPLYHPSSDHVMGKVTPKLKDQANNLLSLFKKAGVDEVFSADTHFYSRFKEPTMELSMTTVGAITADRNTQSPRFAMVAIYSDGSYNVEETEVK